MDKLEIDLIAQVKEQVLDLEGELVTDALAGVIAGISVKCVLDELRMQGWREPA